MIAAAEWFCVRAGMNGLRDSAAMTPEQSHLAKMLANMKVASSPNIIALQNAQVGHIQNLTITLLYADNHSLKEYPAVKGNFISNFVQYLLVEKIC